MNEDLSATIRTGVTVVIVAALVSTVLSLMVVAQTILTAGQGTLQAGVDRVALQQYEVYNGGTQSGTDVRAALSLYSSSDIAIIIHTASMDAGKYYNFNSLLSNPDGNSMQTAAGTKSEEQAGGSTVTVYTGQQSSFIKEVTGQPYVLGALAVTNGITQFNGDIKIVTTKGSNCYILDSARFNSQLIKDKNDLIIGIMFTQR